MFQKRSFATDFALPGDHQAMDWRTGMLSKYINMVSAWWEVSRHCLFSSRVLLETVSLLSWSWSRGLLPWSHASVTCLETSHHCIWARPFSLSSSAGYRPKIIYQILQRAEGSFACCSGAPAGSQKFATKLLELDMIVSSSTPTRSAFTALAVSSDRKSVV